MRDQSRRSRDFYDWWAPFYDVTNRFAAWARGVSDTKERRKAVRRLGLEAGHRAPCCQRRRKTCG